MTIFHLPDLGEGLAEAEIREWYVKTGDVVNVDQPLLSVETAKAVVDVPSPSAGKIIKIYGEQGEMIKTHAPLVEFATDEATQKKDQGTVVGSLEESQLILHERDVIVGAQKNASTIKAMPVVRALAKALQVDIMQITPTGREGQITIDDVKNFAEQQTNSTKKPEQLRGARHFMAMAMAQSHKEVVTATITDDADITEIPSMTDFTAYVIRAIAAAVKIEPALNAWFDSNTMERKLFSQVHLGLAVDSVEGLFVPVIKECENKTMPALREEINRCKQGVKARSLTPQDFQGATLSLSNFGAIAGKYASMIVVPPMVAIVGCGKTRQMAGVKNEMVVVRRIVPLSISFDHRAVTGGEATRFLAAMIDFLENAHRS